MKRNREGLTWEEWARAAGVSLSSTDHERCWLDGEDPAEHRGDADTLERDCPECDASAGEKCEDINGNPWDFFHDARKSP